MKYFLRFILLVYLDEPKKSNYYLYECLHRFDFLEWDASRLSSLFSVFNIVTRRTYYMPLNLHNQIPECGILQLSN